MAPLVCQLPLSFLFCFSSWLLLTLGTHSQGTPGRFSLGCWHWKSNQFPGSPSLLSIGIEGKGPRAVANPWAWHPFCPQAPLPCLKRDGAVQANSVWEPAQREPVGREQGWLAEHRFGAGHFWVQPSASLAQRFTYRRTECLSLSISLSFSISLSQSLSPPHLNCCCQTGGFKLSEL